MKTYESSFISAINSGRMSGIGWLASIGYNISDTLWVSSFDSNVGGAGESIGCIVNVIGISSIIEVESSSWDIGRVSIVLSAAVTNLVTQRQFIGRSVSIWRFVSSQTTITGHDPEFVGVVSDVKLDIETNSYTFICDSIVEKYAKRLPQTTILQSTYPLAPKESYGQKLPIVYGTFEHLTDDGAEVDCLINNFHLVPGVCIDASIGKFVFAHHAVSSLSDTNIAIFDRSLGNYFTGLFLFAGTKQRPTVSSAGPSYCTISLPSNTTQIGADSLYLIPTLKGERDDGQTTDREYLYNQSLFDGVATFGPTSGANRYLTQRFQSIGAEIGFPIVASDPDMKLWAYIASVNGTGTPNYNVCIWNPSSGAAIQYGSSLTSSGWKNTEFGDDAERSDEEGISIASDSQWSSEEISRYEYGIFIDTSGDSVTCAAICLQCNDIVISQTRFDIIRNNSYTQKELYTNSHSKRRPGRRSLITDNGGKYTTTEMTNSEDEARMIATSSIFAELSGRMFGDWIDEEGRDNSKDEGDLIDESNFQIESILRDELGFTSSQINSSEFDAAESGRVNTRFSIHSSTDAYDVISELSQCTNSITFPTLAGKWRHKIIPQDPAGDAVFDAIIDWGDIIALSHEYTSLSSLCNKLNVRYHIDYGTREYRKNYTYENATSQGNTSNGYNHVFEKDMSIPYYRFNSSYGATNHAEAFANAYVQFWKARHSIFKFELLNPSLWNIEEGDIVKFSGVTRNIGGIGAASSANYWASMYAPQSIYWMVIGREVLIDKILLTVFNLHQVV